ncbi:hypothetical protein E2C01_024128 [Portunus trituberculatus]|uniref:Uncharacterized protein n=1 Tax=Portunus trituberculatus TaxID=210409 RepID=A0A5B7EBS4_PORTR|nr:hypothetical protein [Portunus trituberculatus]
MTSGALPKDSLLLQPSPDEDAEEYEEDRLQHEDKVAVHDTWVTRSGSRNLTGVARTPQVQGRVSELLLRLGLLEPDWGRQC